MVENRKSVKVETMPATFVRLAQTQQFYWFLGHLFLLVFYAIDVVSSFFSRSIKYYRYSLLSVLLAYTIVIKQVHFRNKGIKGTIQALSSPEFRVMLIRDENVQYVLLASLYYVASNVVGRSSGSLYSYLIFSLFHVMTYFQGNILPSLPIDLRKQSEINSQINALSERYNQQALIMAANAEFMQPVLAIPELLLLPFRIFSNPTYVIVKLVLYGCIISFLKIRYTSNQYTKATVDQWDMKISQVLHSGRLPPAVGAFYQTKVKGLISAFTAPIKLPALESNKKSD